MRLVTFYGIGGEFVEVSKLTMPLQYELPIHIDASAKTLVDGISINEEVLAKHLETTYLEHEQEVTLTRVKSILCIPRNRVLQLVKQGLLNELPSKQNTHMISGVSIANFLAKYECIERWAGLHHACRGKVLNSLHQAGFGAEMPPFIFNKTERLQNFLTNKYGILWTRQEQLIMEFHTSI